MPTATALTYSATGLPAGVSIDPSTGVISGTLAAGAVGAHTSTCPSPTAAPSDHDTFTWTVAASNTRAGGRLGDHHAGRRAAPTTRSPRT